MQACSYERRPAWGFPSTGVLPCAAWAPRSARDAESERPIHIERFDGEQKESKEPILDRESRRIDRPGVAGRRSFLPPIFLRLFFFFVFGGEKEKKEKRKKPKERPLTTPPEKKKAKKDWCRWRDSEESKCAGARIYLRALALSRGRAAPN